MNIQKVTIPNDIFLGGVKEILAEGKDVIIPTKGNSMLPFIKGEIDSVKLRYQSNPSKWSIVLAELRPGHYVLHRIIKVDGENVTLMGDGNFKNKEYCLMGNIAGTAIEIIKNGKDATDCTTAKAIAMARIWFILRPFRRYLLYIYRHLL